MAGTMGEDGHGVKVMASRSGAAVAAAPRLPEKASSSLCKGHDRVVSPGKTWDSELVASLTVGAA